ncbi:MAG: presqualene diphosphate synthase HpnD [Gammaproteobacteria bacterium]|nr:presqualene diphosphate synthase HpnD [Gammaproteobacteria bacterium]
MTPDQYCQERAASSGSSFYYSFLFLPPLQRRAITAVYAFCREVDDVVDECSDSDIARTKLVWWRQEIQALFQGKTQHPVTQALQPLLDDFDLAEEYFLEIIDGMEMDLEFSGYESFADLQLYCYRVASIVGIMAAEIFGYKNRTTLKYAKDLGMAFQLTNILRDVREDSTRGRIYIPHDELKQFGVKQTDLTQSISTEATHALFKHQAERARSYYQRAFSHLAEEDRYTQRSGIIMSRVYQTLLTEIENDNFNVLKQRIKLTPLRKLWIAWRTASSEKKRHKRFLKTTH